MTSVLPILVEPQTPPMLQVIAFTVYGQPVPAGSKTPWNPRRKDGSLVLRHDGRPVIATMDSTKVRGRDWKNAVASEARVHYSGDLLDGPLTLTLRFFRPRPQGHYSKAGLSKAGRESIVPTGKPDVLKLARAVEDACSAVIWRDDAQIVEEHLEKHWGEPARVEIVVERYAPRSYQ